MPHPREEVFWKSPTPWPTRWQMPDKRRWKGGGQAWNWLSHFPYIYACVGANTNFIEHITSSYLTTVARYLLADGVSSKVLLWRQTDRQTVRYPRKSGSHLGLISRCSSILAIGVFYHTEKKVSRVHSTGKSLDRLSTTIWAGVG